MKIRVLSYNIHKGLSLWNRRHVLHDIREGIRLTRANLVLLQEVQGEHRGRKSQFPDWPSTPQFEFLADKVWPHHAYGQNAVYDDGHHGNAILSERPITRSSNTDVSSTAWLGLRGRWERRGLLHAVLDLGSAPKAVLHAVSTHLGLFEADRHDQARAILALLQREAEVQSEPLIVAGDFNDWGESLTSVLRDGLHLKEAFLEATGAHARTFPAAYPALALDRVYYRNLNLVSVKLLKGEPWVSLSDHLPLLVEFETLEPKA